VVALLKNWAKVRTPPPRAVFLDVKMPHLDGFETLKWIRAQKHLRRVCVVMLSGSGEGRDIELARTLGANDYLVKYPSALEFARAINLESRVALPA
jgi:DNA-binding response OmpR family regulator